MSLSKFIDEPGVPKWQVALAVGGAILVGAGLYYWVFKDSNLKNEKGNTESSKEETGKVIEDDLEANLDELKTPLEQAQSQKNKGNKFFKGGSYESAIKCYNIAIETCPKENKTDLSTFYQNRAAAFEQLKIWENVMRDCTAALELNVRYVKALQRRAKACELLNDLEQALEDLTAICIIESFNNNSTLMNVDRVLKAIGKQHAEEAMLLRQPAMPSDYFIRSYLDSFSEDPTLSLLDKEKEGDVDEMEQQKDTNMTNNGFQRAKQYLLEGKYADIIGCCSNELANPLSTFKRESLVLRATFHLLMMNESEALKDLDMVISEDYVNCKLRANALIKRGSLHMQFQRIEECILDFNTAAQVDPQNADVFHHRGQVNLLLGKIDDALSDFSKAVSSNKNFPIAAVQKYYTEYRCAHQLQDKVKMDQILLQFEESINCFPKCIECYVLYAQVLSDTGELEPADKLYERALEVDPNNPNTLVHRALLLLQWKGDIAGAKELIMKAIELDEKCEIAYENLATIEVQTGNLKRGIELFEKAIPLANTRTEMAHLFSLKDAAVAQLKIIDKLDIKLPHPSSF